MIFLTVILHMYILRNHLGHDILGYIQIQTIL